MKLTKNTVIRATALILFMAMIAAIILYDGGAYDFSFVERPVVYTTADETTGNDNNDPDITTDGSTTDGDETTGEEDNIVTEPPMNDEEIENLLASIVDLNTALKNGYTLSYDKFSKKSALAETSAPYLEGEFSLTTHNVSKTVFYQRANGTYTTRVETKLKALPRIRFYYGYAIVNHGKTNSIYNQNGERISKYIDVEFVYQKTIDGMPIIKSGGKYHKITETGIVEIAENSIDRLPIAVDAPRYFARNSIDLYPFADRVMTLTLIGTATTAPPTTPPVTTTPEITTTEEVTTTPEETTTEAETTTPPETTTEPEITTPEETTTEETTAAPETTTEETTAETTVSETTAEETTEMPLVFNLPKAGAPATAAPKEGDVIEQGGYLYSVSYRILYGYKNSKDEVIIKPQYKMAYDFTSDGLACVIRENDCLEFIDTKGNSVVSLVHNPIIAPEDFNYKKHYQGLYAGINNDVNDLGMYYFDSGYVMVRYTMYDEKTQTKLVKTVNELYDAKGKRVNISGGYSLENYSDGVMLLQKNGKYGYMNTSHSWIAAPTLHEARPFFQGLAVALSDGGYGMIDTNGKTVLPFIFDYISDVSDGKVAAYSAELGWKIYTIIAK